MREALLSEVAEWPNSVGKGRKPDNSRAAKKMPDAY